MARRNGKKMTVTAEAGVTVIEKRFLDAPAREPVPAITIRIGDCIPSPELNTRTHFDEADLRELADSIARSGMLQPLVLHETDVPVKHIVAGERRWRAAMLLGPDTIVPATLRKYSDAELVEIMLTENLHRKDLRPIEEARGFRKALALEGMTQRELAARVNRSQPYISNAVRLLELPDSLLQMIDAGKLAPSIARDVLLPYMAVPEQYRTPFFEAVAAELTGDVDHHQHIVMSIATRRSRSLSTSSYMPGAPTFSAKRHEKECDCGAPKLQFSRYGVTGERRCWNTTWWDAAEREAKAAKKKREQRQVEKAIEGKEQLQGRPVLDYNSFHRKYNWGQFTVVAESDGTFGRDGAFDPTALKPDSLVVVRRGQRYELVSMDVKGVEGARRAFRERVEQRMAEIGPGYFAAEREEASAVAIDGSFVRALLTMEPDDVDSIGRETGIIAEAAPRSWNAPLRDLPDEAVLEVARIAVLRTRKADSEDGYGAPTIEQIVERELAAEYLPALRALIPWDAGAAEQADENLDEELEDAEADSTEMAEV